MIRTERLSFKLFYKSANPSKLAGCIIKLPPHRLGLHFIDKHNDGHPQKMTPPTKLSILLS